MGAESFEGRKAKDAGFFVHPTLEKSVSRYHEPDAVFELPMGVNGVGERRA